MAGWAKLGLQLLSLFVWYCCGYFGLPDLWLECLCWGSRGEQGGVNAQFSAGRGGRMNSSPSTRKASYSRKSRKQSLFLRSVSSGGCRLISTGSDCVVQLLFPLQS